MLSVILSGPDESLERVVAEQCSNEREALLIATAFLKGLRVHDKREWACLIMDENEESTEHIVNMSSLDGDAIEAGRY